MASGREGDTSLWLHNKLGTSNDTWVGGSICSQYNAEVLGNIRECFVYLQPQVKLKLLLSFFHIPRRSADEWHTELEEILELGRADSDPWVAMVAEIMVPFPATGCLSEEFNSSDISGQIFHSLLDEIRVIGEQYMQNSRDEANE
jgi:negative elongation factor A